MMVFFGFGAAGESFIRGHLQEHWSHPLTSPVPSLGIHAVQNSDVLEVALFPMDTLVLQHPFAHF